MSVYVDSVRISGIMGIPNDLPLDLTAPLTLIYAPNGTGKTSVWAAIKALMTMGVDAKIACRAADPQPAKVVGELLIGDASYTATAAAGKLTLVHGTNDRARGTAALRRLAPEVDTTGIQTKGGALKGRLIDQIQGCRFLPAESLLYLIDNGAESTELRRKLYADLTGTSAVQAEIRETTQYRAKLSKELDVVRNALQTIEQQLQEISVVHNPTSSDPLRLIAEAATVAMIQLPPGALASDALSLLRAAQSSKAVSLETSRAAYTTSRSIDSTYPGLDRDLAAAAAALKDANVTRERAQQTLTRAQSALDPARAKRVRQKYDQFRLGSAKVAALVATERRTELAADASLGFMRTLLRRYDSEDAIESRLESLQKLDSSRHEYRAQVSEQHNLLETKKKLVADLHVPAIDLQARLNEKKVQRSELAARITRQSDVAASLRANAQTLVADLQSSTCPCCSHRWPSVEALLGAIAEGDRREQTDPQLKQELEAAESAVGQLYAEYTAASVTEEQLRTLDKRLAELHAVIERTEGQARANNIPPTQLLEVEGTLEGVSTLRSHLSLWRIVEALDDIGEDLDDAQPIEAVLSALSGRGETLKAAAVDAERVETDGKLLVEHEQAALKSSSDLVTRCEEQVLKLTRICHERDAALEQLRSAGLPFGPQTAVVLRERMSALKKLDNLITQISAAVEASTAVTARERIAANQKAQQLRRERIQREIERADRLVGWLTQAEDRAGEQFFDKLGTAVFTLFDHMQVNRVFKTLEFRAVRASFRMGGELDNGVSLDPGSQFSQGQRQDLALSMFLVRAASLGGSFFLDEPLVHLDDLNRTALLDCLRACVLGTASSSRRVRLVVTTANWSVARHLMQKFYSIRVPGAGPALRVIQLSGNVRSKLVQSVVFPASDESVRTVH